MMIKLKSGFSLVEILMAIGLFGLLIGSVNVLMFTSLKNSKKVQAAGLANTEGAYALKAMEQLIRFGVAAQCIGNNRLMITRLNGDQVTYLLDTTIGQISSQSASLPNTIYLTSRDVVVSANNSACGALGGFRCVGNVISICFAVENAKATGSVNRAGSVSTGGIVFRSAVTLRNQD